MPKRTKAQLEAEVATIQTGVPANVTAAKLRGILTNMLDTYDQRVVTAKVLLANSEAENLILNGAAETLILDAPPVNSDWNMLIFQYQLVTYLKATPGRVTVWTGYANVWKDGDTFKSHFFHNAVDTIISSGASLRLADVDFPRTSPRVNSGWYLIYSPDTRRLSWVARDATDLSLGSPAIRDVTITGIAS